jgi:hypothetical protein
LAVLVTLTPGFEANAQDEVPKDLLLTTLNSVAHLKFENDQVTQLMEYNKGFVDEVYVILESDKEDKRKKENLDALSVKRQSDLHDFLSKGETKKYLKYMEEELRPLVKKNKLLKQISKY